ncbi:MAG: acetyl-CoA carboxylase biotin carboxylase subunit [Chromatiaceae bacterium]|jgi:acetyl-CoA carboxylase biotin carboxylase subunit|nr:acetyl-CoA carboxylase biotin carboxylase subunit [Chromatiaceae bacterium]
MKKLKKVLIANRGEIAMRLIRACEELGLESVAVFSEADRMAPHVHAAHEAYCIGPPPALESYLRVDKLIDVARRAGADSVHPGYGFLAEKADAAEAFTQAGITWIGPAPETIRRMGDKLAARAAMIEAGVPLVPGIGGKEESLSDQDLMESAKEVGFPMMVKAAAGGGGKGMRQVYRMEELAEAIRIARREAESAFGDDRVYIERLIANARHIEVQLLGDQHGNIIHLGERDCSIQRRHQKLIEESPSPVVDPELRAALGAAAVRAAQAANYHSAGTVEFILDNDTKEFFFLEMNTRLQVEHTVTERVTGIDIARAMLSIADGEPLQYRQKDVQQRGWSIECRIVAEDPRNNFMPAIGRIVGLTVPTGPGVRVDTGIWYGSEITPYYDSLLAKLVIRDSSREAAIIRTRRALEEFQITGVPTVIPFLIQMLDSPEFRSGQVHTKFLEDEFHFNREHDPEVMRTAAVAAALLAHRRTRRALALTDVAPSPWRLYGRREALDRRLK